MNRRALIFYWAPVLVYAAAILFMSSQQQLPAATQRIPDKLLHAAEYFGFALVIARAILGGGPLRNWKQPAAVLLSAGLFGAFDEFYQSFIPGRDSSILDWAADLTGIALLISLLLLQRSKELAPSQK